MAKILHAYHLIACRLAGVLCQHFGTQRLALHNRHIRPERFKNWYMGRHRSSRRLRAGVPPSPCYFRGRIDEPTLYPKYTQPGSSLISALTYHADNSTQDEFKGTVIHSSRFKSARNYPGKKVVVVGTGPSGHDISSDCVQHGVGKCCHLNFSALY